MMCNFYNFNSLNLIGFNLYICRVNFYNFIIFKFFCFKFLNKNIYILNNINKKKYNWSNNYLINQTINLNGSLKIFSYNLNTFKHKNNLILFKKKLSIFKKNLNYNQNMLSFLNSNNNIFNKKNLNYKKKKLVTKFLDFNKGSKLYIRDNRKILKFFFNIKFYRNRNFNKYIKKFCNSNKSFLNLNLEFNILNILLNSKLINNKNDCHWFIKNKLVFLNFKVVNDSKIILKPYDVITINFSSNYYYYYRNSFEFFINNSYKIKLKQFHFRINYKKKLLNEKTLSMVNFYFYFNKDVPLYLEVDFLSLSCFILNYKNYFKYFNRYNIKFINFYLNRLYNWKYII